MSKELEMLHDFVKWNEDFKSLQFNVKGYGNGRNVEQAHQELIELEKLLTPPTAEDICKELGEYYGVKVMFENNEFYYKERANNISIVGLSARKVNNKVIKNCVDFYPDLPPHLVEMIGKFYKGKVKE